MIRRHARQPCLGSCRPPADLYLARQTPRAVPGCSSYGISSGALERKLAQQAGGHPATAWSLLPGMRPKTRGASPS